MGGWAGIVCNIMETFATGMNTPYDTGMWAYLEKMGILVKTIQDVQSVRIGDWLWEQGHGMMISGIWRDEHGVVTQVGVSSGGVSGYQHLYTDFEQHPYAHNVFPLSDFNVHLKNGYRAGSRILYRRVRLFDNLKFTEIPFPLDGESKVYTYNDDICTFAGDRASFREGERIVLNYNLKENNGWTQVELYKDDTLFGTYLLSNDVGTYDSWIPDYPSTEENNKIIEMIENVPSHSFDLSFLNLTYGSYKARLTDGNGNYSDYTYFEILKTTVSYLNDIEGNTHITFSKVYGNPKMLRFSKINGGPKAAYELSDEDINRGYCYIDVKRLISEQYNNLNDEQTYLKVYFEGSYGRVTNEPILFNI